MIKIQSKPVKEAPKEMTINAGDVKIIKYLPACPECNLIDDVVFFNITKKTYECTKCNLRFRFA
jgi:hypothetical protein